jgi:hypothetical protein
MLYPNFRSVCSKAIGVNTRLALARNLPIISARALNTGVTHKYTFLELYNKNYKEQKSQSIQRVWYMP